jgi:hypothetical protein
MPSTYEPIATQTLASAVATISFTSIPATYTDLKIILNGTQTGGNLDLQFNSDTATNYSQTYIYGDGTNVATASRLSVSQIQLSEYSALNSTTPSNRYIDIFSYAGTSYKTVINVESQDNNGTGFTLNGVGMWRSTSAITSISLTATGANTLKIGTIATLYGIKAA